MQTLPQSGGGRKLKEGVWICVFSQVDPHSDSSPGPPPHELQHHRRALLHRFDRKRLHRQHHSLHTQDGDGWVQQPGLWRHWLTSRQLQKPGPTSQGLVSFCLRQRLALNTHCWGLLMLIMHGTNPDTHYNSLVESRMTRNVVEVKSSGVMSCKLALNWFF